MVRSGCSASGAILMCSGSVRAFDSTRGDQRGRGHPGNFPDGGDMRDFHHVEPGESTAQGAFHDLLQ